MDHNEMPMCWIKWRATTLILRPLALSVELIWFPHVRSSHSIMDRLRTDIALHSHRPAVSLSPRKWA